MLIWQTWKSRLVMFLAVVGPGDAGYGFYGPKTEEAVKEYQKMRGLASDGVCGPATWRETGL